MFSDEQQKPPTFFKPGAQEKSLDEKPTFFSPTQRTFENTPKVAPPLESPYFKSPGPPPLVDSFLQSTPTPTLPLPIEQEVPVTRDKIDPGIIPSPGLYPYPDCYRKTNYGTNSIIPPPSSMFPITVVDEGICNPRFMRPTCFNFPNNDALVKKTHVIIGATITPFSDLDGGDFPNIVPQVVHQGGPLRCSRCRAYLNCFSSMTINSRGYSCNFCTFVNDLPDWYIYDERTEKPELKFGSIDYVATKEYCAKPPTPLAYIFVVDTNGPVNAIFDVIRKIPLMNECSYGLITFNKTVQFYSASHPQVTIMGDIDEVFVPVPLNKILIPGYKFHAYLDSIEKLIVQDTGCAFGIAMDVARELLGGGGRVIAFTSGIPDMGKGKIVPRDEKNYGTRQERDLFGPQEGFWKQFADVCAGQQVAVDLFLITNKYVEAATLGYVCTKTCGSIFSYKNDLSPLRADLTRVLTRDTVYDAVLKVRCSSGLSIKGYHGSFFRQTNDDIDLPGIDADATFFVELKYDQEVPHVYLQCAVLYTSRLGQRMIRVHTGKYTVVNNPTQLYRYSDMDAHLGAVARFASALVIKNRDSMDIVKRFITEQAISILSMYRKECSKSQNNGQLVLPDSLKLLPVYFLGLMKSNAFRPGVDISIDERMIHLHRLEKISNKDLIHYCYPTLFNLANMPDRLLDTSFPAPLSLSSTKVNQEGIYLLNDTRNTYIWVGKRCPVEIVNALFTVPYDEIKLDTDFAPDNSDYSKRVVEILQELGSSRVIVCKAGLSSESTFYSKLIEDRTVSGTQSYIEFLSAVHKEIQSRLYG